MGGESRNQADSTLPLRVEKPVGQQIESIYQGRLRQFTDEGMFSPALETALTIQVNTTSRVSERKLFSCWRD